MTFTPNKNIETPAHGADVNTWDVNANANFTLIDTCFSGTLLLNATGLSGTQALTQTNVQPPFIQISGAPTAAITYTVPTGIGGTWTVRNTTTGGFTVGIASAAGGSTVNVVASSQAQVVCDGTATGMLVTTTPSITGILTGVVLPFAGTTAPVWALFCDGSVVSQATYAALFASIGTAYNTGGEGGGNFRLPDMRGRTAYGLDNINGTTSQNRLNLVMAPNSTTRGATGGSQTHNHVGGGMDPPTLTVNVDQTGAGAQVNVAAQNHQHANPFTSSANIVAPGLLLNYIIGI